MMQQVPRAEGDFLGIESSRKLFCVYRAHSVRDLARGEWIWNELRVLTPAKCLVVYQ